MLYGMDAAPRNGTPATPPTTLKEVRAKRRLLEEQLRLEELENRQKAVRRTRQLLEHSSWPDDDWGGSEMWTRLRDGGTRWPWPAAPSDRRKGGEWPLWRTQTELDELRQKSRVLSRSNSFARGLLKNLINYVLGPGLKYKCQSKKLVDASDRPGVQEQPQIKQLLARCQDLVDKFLRVNGWNGTTDPRSQLVASAPLERELYRRVLRDGEAFVRFYRDRDNCCVYVRFIEPEQIRGEDHNIGLSFGIGHKHERTENGVYEDVRTPVFYRVYWTDPTGQEDLYEDVESPDVLHVKDPETDSTVKRGTPLFVWDTAAALERAAKLQNAISMGSWIRACTAEMHQFEFGTEAQISSLAAGLKEADRTDPVTGNTDRIERVRPGMIRRVPVGQNYVNPPTDQSPQYLQALDGDLRQGAAAASAPTYWLGEINDANYSNLETASAPAVKNGEVEQAFLASACARVAWEQLKWAVECGRLPKEALTLIDLQVEGPQVLHRNELEVTQANQMRVQAGWKSPQTVAMEEGLDWEIEAANMEEHQDRFGGGGGMLTDPSAGGGMDDTGDTGDEPSPDEGGVAPAVPESRATRLLEAILLEAGFTGTVKDSLGRERHFVNGKPVKGHQDDEGGGGRKKKASLPATPAARKAAAAEFAAGERAQKAAAQVEKAKQAYGTARSRAQRVGAPPEASAAADKAYAKLQAAKAAHQDARARYKAARKAADQAEKGGEGEGKAEPKGKSKPAAQPPAEAPQPQKPPEKPAEAPPATPQRGVLSGKAAELAGGYKATIAKQLHLSDRQKAEYSKAVDHVVSRMPPKALERLEAGVKDLRMHGSDRELTATLANEHPEIMEGFLAGEILAQGAYDHGPQRLHLDGATDFTGFAQGGVFGEKTVNAHETYAHEMAHAIDGPGQEHSQSEEWLTAWASEVALSGGATLSRYAATEPSEGFAEFGRLVYGTDAARVEVEKAFPKMSAYFKGAGLWL